MRTLRVLAILTKRQIADDGPLLVGAFVGTVLFLLTLGAMAFVYPRGFLLHVVTILFILPALLCLGCFVLGLVQVRGDENRGIPAMLSVLPVSPSQIILARVVTGMLFVLAVAFSLMLAITRSILSGLIQWPESLIPGGLVDLSVTLLLIGLSCYCLGALGGRGWAGWLTLLWLLPLTLVSVSLIVIKGLGAPLVIVLVPFVAASLVWPLLCARHSRLVAVSLSLVVIFVMAVPLYWLRFGADTVIGLVVLETSGEATVALYREFRPTRNGYSSGPFTVDAQIRSDDFPLDLGCVHPLLRPLGIVSYLQAKEPARGPIDLHHFGNYWGFYYDVRKGLFVDCSTQGVLYAGPEGVDDTPAKRLGRFMSPIVCSTRPSGPLAFYEVSRYYRTVFDPQSGCFYEIRFDERDVHKGLRLTDTAFRPVDPLRSAPGGGICSLRCGYSPPRDKEPPYAKDRTGDFQPVVDESGAIAVMDQKTWELFPNAGRLPRPRTFFGRASSKPKDLFDYGAAVIVKRPGNEYAGLIAASVSRQGTLATIAVFDGDGRLLDESRREAKFSPILLFTPKYLIESLNPPILTLASFFTAYSFEAGSTHRALFLMPNSFVALQRDRETGFIFQFLFALLFLLPALLFAGFLSWRAVRDARIMGLSRTATWWWGVGVLAFGLPAYITYRLTRPRVALALCRDCGRGRRVDHDVCHHCGSGWNGPVLEPPAWRIVSP
jgi:hypothetical protein